MKIFQSVKVGLTPTKSRFLKIIIIISGVIAVSFYITTFFASDSILAERMTKTIEEGDLSGRDNIWTKLVPYISSNPIFGYGETGYVDISRVSFRMVKKNGEYVYGFSPHNVIIELLLYTGLIGLFMWLLFWYKLFVYAWKCYRSGGEIVPLILIIPIASSILSAQIITGVWAYFVYTYIIVEYRMLFLVPPRKRIKERLW